MNIRGHWKDGHYIPEPSMKAFEECLAAVIATQRCAHCSRYLGLNPRIMIDKRQYHPACWNKQNA